MTWNMTPLPLLGGAAPLALLQAACFPEDPWGCEALERILALPGAFGTLAWAHDEPHEEPHEEPIGYVLARDLGEEAEILSLGVVPQWRGVGFGARILDAAAIGASELGLQSMVLEVAEINNTARRLYSRFGFVQVGRRPNYYRQENASVDALIMRCAIAGRGTA